MQIKVKAGSIQSLTDARYFSSKEVEWLGFTFDQQHPHFVQPRQAQQIMGWLQGPNVVGEFGEQSPLQILEVAMILNLPLIQAPIEVFEERLLNFEGKLMPVLQVNQLTDGVDKQLKHMGDKLEVILIKADEQQLQEQKSKIEEWTQKYPALLAGYTNSNMLQLTEELGFKGIEVIGSIEEQVGIRSFEQLDELFEELYDEF